MKTKLLDQIEWILKLERESMAHNLECRERDAQGNNSKAYEHMKHSAEYQIKAIRARAELGTMTDKWIAAVRANAKEID